MSLLEIIAIPSVWAAVSVVIVVAVHRFCWRQPQQAASDPPKCTCGICTGKVQTIDLMMSPQQLASVQTAVLAVGIGAAPVMGLGFDHVNAYGVGRVCIVIMSGPLFERVVEPAIKQHLAATRSGT
jgi:hypothetical protein